VELRRSGECGSSQRRGGDTRKSESGKLAHDFILQWFAIEWRLKNLFGDPERQIATTPD
jgi:hypothetical protein